MTCSGKWSRDIVNRRATMGGPVGPDPCPVSQKGESALFLGIIRNLRLEMKCTVYSLCTTREGEVQVNHG